MRSGQNPRNFGLSVRAEAILSHHCHYERSDFFKVFDFSHGLGGLAERDRGRPEGGAPAMAVAKGEGRWPARSVKAERNPALSRFQTKDITWFR